MGLLPATISKISDGTINFDSKSVGDLSEKELQQLRGNQIAMIFQEPMSSLNPSLKCGFQVQEILLQHTDLSTSETKRETLSLFESKIA
jgi:peptide/nickel transport system ATP-binding protein